MGGQEKFSEKYRRLIRLNEGLAAYTTFGIGGPAEMLAEVSSVEDLVGIVVAARAGGIPVIVLGEGSNLLIGDGGVDGRRGDG